MTEIKKQRSASPDLLRIISMLLIVFLHSIDHSGVLENAAASGAGIYAIVMITYSLCRVCVNIYVMLSGYFLVTSRFRLHKLCSLWMEAAFYSVVLKLVFMLLGKEPFSPVSLASCLFPIFTGRYWFLTIYAGLYLISPFLNKLIRALDKKRHGLLNIILFCLVSVMISVHPAFAGMNSGGGWGLAWFVTLYLCAAWFRLYYEPKGRPVLPVCAYFAVGILVAVAYMGAEVIGIGLLKSVVSLWFRYDSFPVYIMSLSLFIGFLNIKIKGARLSRLISFIAPYTFGVYLIHAHANVSPWIWETLALPERMSSYTFVLIQAGAVLAIFFICVLIDIARKHTLGYLENSRALKKLCDNIQSRVTSLVYSVVERI